MTIWGALSRSLERSMRIGRVAALCGAAFGCGRRDTTRTQASADAGAHDPSLATLDSQCPGGFSDRTGKCEDVDPAWTFGVPCVRKETLEGPIEPSTDRCGPHLCIAGRCRSCMRDIECQLEMGAPECRTHLSGSDAGSSVLGHRVRGYECGSFGGDPEWTSPPPIPAIWKPSYEELTVRVEKIYPHATDAFTEGIVYDAGWIYESTGLEGRSTLRKVDLQTGTVQQSVALDRTLFGEGLALVGNQFIQLTYQSGRALVWDRNTFQLEREFSYDGEGWGLCFDGQRLVMSNGTHVLQFRDPETFEVLGTVDVLMEGAPLEALNELECVGTDIYANVWKQRGIARIDAATGTVTAWIDPGSLLEQTHTMFGRNSIDVENGIGYMPETGHLLLTGKWWPGMFEVSLVPFPE